MNEVLARWNSLPPDQAADEVLACCGSHAWSRGLASRRPLDEAGLVAVSDEIWKGLSPDQWMEAFSTHPRIGEMKPPASAGERSAAWSSEEQEGAAGAGPTIQAALAAGNRAYEKRFGRVFLVCATGKSADAVLRILLRRLQNDDAAELLEAAEEQRKITNLRLKKWLAS